MPETIIPPAIWIIIVNFRTPELTIDCLASLASELQAQPNTRVKVIDNASGDGSVERIEDAIASSQWTWASIEAADRNGGFAYGNNIALRQALVSENPPDYLWLLNPDTLVRQGALTALVQHLETHPDMGIIGSRLEDLDGTPQCSAFRFPTLLGELNEGIRIGWISKQLSRWVIAPPVSNTAGPTDWVSGASLMMRYSVLEAVGLLDDAYFMYFEELDFCRRAHQAGWPCCYQPTSHVVHLVGQSSGINRQQPTQKRRPQYWFDSRRRYFLKHHGWLYTALTDTLWMTGFALWRLRVVLQRKPDPDPPQFLQDFFWNSILLRGIRA